MRKDQKHLSDSIEKMKTSHRSLHVASLDLNSFQDGCSDTPPSNRKHRHISIEEYKKFVDAGYTLEDFTKEGISKHYIGFLNTMLKGKITISKEEFEREYVTNQLKLEEVSEKYNISREHVTYLREYFGFKRKNGKIYNRYKRENTIEFTPRQLQIALGSLLGDATIKTKNMMGFKHSGKQRDYCSWKLNEFKEHTNYNELKVSESYDERFETSSITVYFDVLPRKEIMDLYELTYIDSKKTVTQKWLNQINELGLAIWFMDDGGTEWGYRNGIKEYENSKPMSKIYTCGFSIEENNLIIAWFKQKWGINCYMKFKMPDQQNPYLNFSTDDTAKLHELIRPYVIDCMRYKIDEEKYISYIDKKKHNIKPSFSKFEILSEEEQNKLIDEIFNQYRNSGFPYIRLSDKEIKRSFERLHNTKPSHLLEDDGSIKQNITCSSLIKNFQVHMFEMAQKNSLSPIEVFSNDETFKDAIRRRLKYGGQCTDSGIRQISAYYKNNRWISNFSPAIAKCVYDTELNPNSSVFDFCAGFGGRLLGALASDNVAKYVCIDPLKRTCEGLLSMKNEYSKYIHTDKDIRIIDNTAEDTIDSINEQFDMVFTSPPYYDLEVYEKDESQCYNRYNAYNLWLEQWLIPIIRKSINKIKTGGKLVLSVGKYKEREMFPDIVNKIEDIIKLEKTIWTRSAVNEYNRKNKTFKLNGLYVFKKS